MSNVTFTSHRDNYGRAATAALQDGKQIGAIVKLPKRTFPTPTWMVNDFRITQPLMLAGKAKEAHDAVVHVGSLAAAKALLTA